MLSDGPVTEKEDDLTAVIGIWYGQHGAVNQLERLAYRVVRGRADHLDRQWRTIVGQLDAPSRHSE